MSRRRGRGRGPHGFVIVDKPRGPTSFKVMRAVARQLGGVKAGHAGTLDPAATGVLVVLLGEATKLSRWLVGHDKRYRATVRFGVATDTLDAEGAVTAEVTLRDGGPSAAQVGAALAALVGPQRQLPPRYSAIKVDGRSLMSRARVGDDVPVAPRSVTCHALTLWACGDGRAVVDVHCGAGYYVRSLARDVGALLGLPAHLEALRRTRSGAFDIAGAVPADAVDEARVRPLVEAAPDVPHLTVTAAEAARVRDGRPIAAPGAAPRAILVDPAATPLAMVERDDQGLWRVVRGLRVGAGEAAERPNAAAAAGAKVVVDNAGGRG